MKKCVKICIWIVAVLVLVFAVTLGLLTLFDKRSDEELSISVHNEQQAILDVDQPFTITTFNIGYAGLDANQDFFMDGGSGSRSSSKEQTLTNLGQMMSFLNTTSSDFYFVQEVDTKATRSYSVNEVDVLRDNFIDYSSAFAWNYDSPFVPIPLSLPMGYVHSGIMTFSKVEIEDATRSALPGDMSWPISLFELNRCILVENVKLSNGKTLTLINLHLSAYDKGGTVREQEMAYLKTLMEDLYEDGNYVVLGGDWNNLLSDVQLSDPTFIEQWPDWLVKLPSDFLNTDFQWAVDDTTYTVRDNNKPYVEGESFVTFIDGFLVSPNIEIQNVTGHNLNFENSDHNPVSVTLKLK